MWCCQPSCYTMHYPALSCDPQLRSLIGWKSSDCELSPSSIHCGVLLDTSAQWTQQTPGWTSRTRTQAVLGYSGRLSFQWKMLNVLNEWVSVCVCVCVCVLEQVANHIRGSWTHQAHSEDKCDIIVSVVHVHPENCGCGQN